MIPAMRSFRVFLLLLCCAGYLCQSCNRTRAYFTSRNFYSVLRWNKVEIPGREVRYSIGYAEYGASLTPLMGCQNISEPYCDFSDVFSNVRSRYFAKITVDGTCVGQYSDFNLLAETILEAPKLSVIPDVSSITVTLTEPMGPRKLSISEITCWESCQKNGRPSVNYIIRLTRPKSESGKVFKNTTSTVVLNHLQVDTEYCGVALYQLSHPSVPKQSENVTFCVTLPGEGGLWIYIVMVLGSVTLVLIILGFVVCQLYLKRKRNLPKVLIMSMRDFPNFQIFPDPKMDVLNVHAECPQSLDQTAPGLFTVLGKSDQNHYASQDCQTQACHCHSYINTEGQGCELLVQDCDRSSESCTSYSMVVGVMKPQEFSSFASDSGLGDSLSPGLDWLPEDEGDVFSGFCQVQPDRELNAVETDPYANTEPLLLPVSRGASGKLQFSRWAFQPLLTSITESTQAMPPVMASTPAEEKSPFLSDQDSGREEYTNYARTYLPNGVPDCCSELPNTEPISGVSLPDCTSNYRENWVPGILPTIQQKDRNSSTSTNSLNAPHEDMAELKLGFGALSLDGCIQVQS